VTSNSMAAAANVMKIGVATPSYRYHVCAAIANVAKGLSNSADSWRLATATLKKYAKECKEVVISADKFLVEIDPAYETSEDRRTLLREVAARRLNDYQVNYATNALNRIRDRLRADKAQGSERKEH